MADTYPEGLNPTARVLADSEGYRISPYAIAGNEKSGIAIGNAVDFGQQSPASLKKMGVAPATINKISNSGLFGLRGSAAENRLAELQKAGTANFLTADEIMNLSNAAANTVKSGIIKDIGQEQWDGMTPGMQSIGVNILHQYGESEGRNTKGYDQWKRKDIPALRANLLDWQDQSKQDADAINKRYAGYVDRLPAERPNLQEAYQAAQPEITKASFLDPNADIPAAVPYRNEWAGLGVVNEQKTPEPVVQPDLYSQYRGAPPPTQGTVPVETIQVNPQQAFIPQITDLNLGGGADVPPVDNIGTDGVFNWLGGFGRR